MTDRWAIAECGAGALPRTPECMEQDEGGLAAFFGKGGA